MPFVIWRGSTAAPLNVPCPFLCCFCLLSVSATGGALAALVLGVQEIADVLFCLATCSGAAPVLDMEACAGCTGAQPACQMTVLKHVEQVHW